MDLQQEIYQDGRKQLNPYIWRDKYYSFNIAMNSSGNRLASNSVVVSNSKFILDRITFRTIQVEATVPPVPQIAVQVRFAVNQNYLNNDFVDARLLFGSVTETANLEGNRVIPLIQRWYCKPGDSLVIDQRNAPREAPGEIIFDYIQQWTFHGFEQWNT